VFFRVLLVGFSLFRAGAARALVGVRVDIYRAIYKAICINNYRAFLVY